MIPRCDFSICLCNDENGICHNGRAKDCRYKHMRDRATPKPPILDENATDRFGKPVPRCQVCGYALDLQIEQYCPCCGQRLTEYEVKE